MPSTGWAAACLEEVLMSQLKERPFKGYYRFILGAILDYFRGNFKELLGLSKAFKL